MPAKKPSGKYLARATAFAQAIDVGTAIAKTVPGSGWEEWNDLFKRPALEPEPAFATLSSLAYLEDAFFTHWNDASGEHIESFWQRLAERGLPFQRKDIVREVLSRGRIRTEMEYQSIVDALAIQRQLERLSHDEAEHLNRMVGEFEQRANRAHRSRSR